MFNDRLDRLLVTYKSVFVYKALKHDYKTYLQKDVKVKQLIQDKNTCTMNAILFLRFNIS